MLCASSLPLVRVPRAYLRVAYAHACRSLSRAHCKVACGGERLGSMMMSHLPKLFLLRTRVDSYRVCSPPAAVSTPVYVPPSRVGAETELGRFSKCVTRTQRTSW